MNEQAMYQKIASANHSIKIPLTRQSILYLEASFNSKIIKKGITVLWEMILYKTIPSHNWMVLIL